MSKSKYLVSSFWAMNTHEQHQVRAFADHADKTLLDVRGFYLNRVAYGAVIDDGTRSLEQFNTISPIFDGLNAQQREEIEGQLLLTYYQLSTQYELERIERMSYKLPEIATQIRLCANLINQLRLTSVEPKMSRELLQMIASSGKYTQYLGLKLLVPALLESIDTMASHQKSVTDFISFINERRLYWVWAGSTVSILLSLFPDYLADTSHATAALGWTGLIGGSLSWILYFMRAGLAWHGLIEHTFFPTKEERALGLTLQERFWVQWDMRKYQILNDTIWGMCNFACFFVLVGSGLLGNIGNAFTASLLLMDAILTMWRMYEEETEHRAKMKRFSDDHAVLKRQIDWAKKMGQSAVKYEMAYQETTLKAHMADLEWKYKKTMTAIDLLYSTFLLTAFVLLCCSVLFMPYTAVVLAVSATVMCFTFNLIYNTATMVVNVSKAKHIQREFDDALLKQLGEFKQLFEQYEKAQGSEQRQPLEGPLKMAYLQMKALRAESVYQQKMVMHQRNHLIISTIRDVLIPTMFIASLVFLPLGIGVPLLILSFTIAFGLYEYSQKTMPKKAESVRLFPEASYEKFSREALTHSPQELALLLDSEKTAASPGIQPKYVYN